MKELIKGSAIIFLFKIIGAASLFLINIIISNMYGAQYLGVYNLLFAMFQIVAIFSRAGLDIYLVKMLPTLGDDYSAIAGFIKKTLSRVFLLSLAIGIFVFLTRTLINDNLFRTINSDDYLILFSFLIIPYTFFTVIPEILRGLDEIKIYSFLKNGILSFSILSFLLIIYFFNSDPIYSLFFGISSSFLIAVFVVAKFLNNRKIRILGETKKFIKPLLRESYPMFLTTSLLFLMGNLDSFMIGYFKDEYEVGLYNACVRLSFLITFVLASINGFISPKLSKFFHQGNFIQLRKIYYQSLKIIWLVVIPVVLMLYMFPEFFLGIFGDEFRSAKLTLLILNTGYLINSLFGPVGHLLNMTNNHKKFMRIVLFAFLINFLGNVLLIPKYGIQGAAISTLASMALWNIIAFLLVKKLKLV